MQLLTTVAVYSSVKAMNLIKVFSSPCCVGVVDLCAGLSGSTALACDVGVTPFQFGCKTFMHFRAMNTDVEIAPKYPDLPYLFYRHIMGCSDAVQ